MQNNDTRSPSAPIHNLKERFLINAFLTKLLVEKMGLQFDIEESDGNQGPQLSQYYHDVTQFFQKDLKDFSTIQDEAIDNAWQATTPTNVEKNRQGKPNQLIKLAMGCYIDSITTVYMNEDELDFSTLQYDLNTAQKTANQLAILEHKKLQDQPADGHDVAPELTAMIELVNEHVHKYNYIDPNLLKALSALSPTINNITDETPGRGIENSI